MWSKKKDRTKAKSTFINVTHCDPKVADTVLKKFNHSLQNALNYYWSHRDEYPANVPAAPSQANVKALDAVFDKFASEEEKDSTSADGLMEFYKAVDVDAAHRHALYIVYLLKTEEQGVISRQEFVQGFGKMRAFKISDIKTKIKSECASIDRSSEQFKKFYAWLFFYLKESKQKKSIGKDVATLMWGIVLKDRGLQLLDDLINFVDESEEEIKGITEDTWVNVKKFLETCKDPKTFENDGAWPILIDNYLEAKGNDT